MNRKTFVTTLGAMGLGLGAVVAPLGGAPAAQAQEGETSEVDVRPATPFEEGREQREDLYADFTAALAVELGIANADEVDAAIRIAIMSVIDQREADGLLTYGQAEALKTLVATAEVPLGPVLMGGGLHEDVIRARFAAAGFDRGGGHVFLGGGEERGPIIERIREKHAAVEEGQGSRADDRGEDVSQEEDNEDAS